MLTMICMSTQAKPSKNLRLISTPHVFLYVCVDSSQPGGNINNTASSLLPDLFALFDSLILLYCAIHDCFIRLAFVSLSLH